MTTTTRAGRYSYSQPLNILPGRASVATCKLRVTSSVIHSPSCPVDAIRPPESQNEWPIIHPRPGVICAASLTIQDPRSHHRPIAVVGHLHMRRRNSDDDDFNTLNPNKGPGTVQPQCIQNTVPTHSSRPWWYHGMAQHEQWTARRLPWFIRDMPACAVVTTLGADNIVKSAEEMEWNGLMDFSSK